MLLRVCVALMFVVGAFAPAQAAKLTTSPAAPLAIGETFALDSKVLGELRVVNVYVPPGYASGDARYPVLYLLDGGIDEDFPHVAGAVDISVRNAVIRPLIVVGLKNVERRRDLLSATDVPDEKKIAPNAGGSDRFRTFLREELKPLVASRYRTTNESALIGESFAGLFVMETLVETPDLFDTYVAVSPALWWNDRALVKTMPDKLAAWSTPGRRLWLASAGDDVVEATRAAADALRAAKPMSPAWQYEPLAGEKHATIFPVATLRALRALFAATP
ncbi:MAG TPA: alpha/beta hydrolase-fold protein [Tahibacter sp.]|nr:alpha/beta hydrolase-fold protein [Tahibacter sp.]